MGRLYQNGFNNTLEGLMGANVSAATQSLLIQVRNSKTRKSLEGIRCSIVQNTVNPIASTDRYARLIVCTGNLSETSEEPVSAYLPFFRQQINADKIVGIDRIIYSTVIKNEFTIDFSHPILVIEGEILNVILGASWSVADTLASPSDSHAMLAVYGREFLDGADNFDYKMS